LAGDGGFKIPWRGRPLFGGRVGNGSISSSEKSSVKSSKKLMSTTTTDPAMPIKNAAETA